jgi:hypothetical protein
MARSLNEPSRCNSIYLPGRATLVAGIRYHWTLRSHRWTVRLDRFNLIDTCGLRVSSLDEVPPKQPRRFVLTFATINNSRAKPIQLPASARAFFSRSTWSGLISGGILGWINIATEVPGSCGTART